MSRDLDALLAKLAATPRERPPLHAFSGTKRFEIRRRLGSGSFGDVYEARDRESGAVIALKGLKSSQPEWVYRFKREFRLVAELSHPNIVQVFELFCEDDRWYLTMELVDGLPLDEYLERRPEQLRASFTQLARGLAALHGAGCLHRDVKPTNALVEPTGRVVLLDFGLSLDLDQALHTAVAGTPPFMAPESASGARPSEASDWYAFGVMLYAALAGELPYRGGRTEVFEQKLAHAPRPPSSLRSNVDPQLEALALRLLAPRAEDRPGAEEILVQLGDGGRRTPRAVDPDALLVGRERELGELARALDAAALGTPLFVSVRGEPGMGKTVLLGELAARARSRGIQLYAGRCQENEELPYKGVDPLVDALCMELGSRDDEEVAALVPPDVDALTQMFPVLKRLPAFARARRDPRVSTPKEARRRAARGLRELVRRLCAASPLMLVVDDVHWGNEEGLQLVAELLAPPTPPVVVIVAYRTGEAAAAPALQALLAAVEASSLPRLDLAIGPLDEAGVAAFLQAAGATVVTPEKAMAETGGHPFLLARLLGGQAWSNVNRVDLTTRISGEIAALRPEARQLLEVISLAARPISERTGFAVLDRPPDPRLLDELRRNRLIQRRAGGTDGEVSAYHDRVRETAVAGIAPARARELHLRLAQLLETRGRLDPEALAHHYRHGGDRVRALGWARRAAHHAGEALALGRAEQLLAGALELVDDERTRLEVLQELGEARVQVGRCRAAAEACFEAAELAARLGDARASASLRARAGRHFLVTGHFDRGFELVGAALAEVGLRLPTTAAQAIGESINGVVELAARGLDFQRRAPGDLDPAALRRVDVALEIAHALSLTDVRGPWVAVVALRDALALGEPVRVLRALAFFVLNSGVSYPFHPLILAARDRGKALGAELGDEVGLAFMGLADATLAIYRWELPASLERFREVERRFRALGSVHAREASLARFLIALLCGMHGMDPPHAISVADELFQETQARGDLFTANWVRMLLSWVDLMGDDPASARRHVTDARREWGAIDSLHAVVACTNEMLVELYDRPETAWAHAERITPAYRRLFSSMLPPAKLLHARLTAAAAVAACDAGRLERGEALAHVERCLEEIARLERADQVRLLLEGLRHGLRGDRRGYAEALERSSQEWASVGQRAAALSTLLRVRQARRDEAGETDLLDQLAGLGIAAPARYAIVYAGPLPRFGD